MPVEKINLREKAAKNKGEYVLGAEDTGSHACYMIYGILKAGEKGREVKPGKGHEEIITSFSGNLKLTGHHNIMLEEGEAIHLADEQTCFLENIGNSEIVYIIAGGHSGRGHSDDGH